MSVREANCPSCGASITFANAAAVMVVCPHCGTASVRKDAVLEKLGRVAEIAPIESAVSLGASGKWRAKRFSVVGQVQLDHGKGPWNEWAILFEDGRTGWLAEAQGEFLVTLPYAASDAADQSLGVGSKISVAGETLVVVEAGRAKVTTARGELPEDLRPGTSYQYFDLRGPNDRFGTIAATADGEFETWLGWAVPREALDIDESTVAAAAPRRATPDRVGCPSCGAPIQIRDPANAMRVVCSACGAMTDPRDRKLRVIEKAKRLEARPTIPIGAKGRLFEQQFEVLAFLVRSVRADGVRYPWEEYLLRRADGAYRWLVCTDGHWTFAEPVNVGATTHDYGAAYFARERFEHFQTGDAVVDHVQGEVYWEVAIGERVQSKDYVSPPRMLSFESSAGEFVCSLGRYVEPAEMAAAFPGVTKWRHRSGIAPNQPNPWSESAARCWKLAGALAAATIALMIWFGATDAGRVVATVRADAPSPAEQAAAAAQPASADAAAPVQDKGVAFSDEFRIEPSSSNLEIGLSTQVSNAWLGVDGALVELDTGDVRPFEIAAEYYSGVDGGEAWSEGDRDATVYLGAVPAGRYALRLDAESQAQSGPASFSYTLVAKNQVPSTGRGFLLLLFLLAPPALVTVLGVSFETRRWSTSDHAPGGND